MKILKEGKLPVPEWVGKICDCDDCGTQFQLEYGDFLVGALNGNIFVHCPLCKKGVLVSTVSEFLHPKKTT